MGASEKFILLINVILYVVGGFFYSDFYFSFFFFSTIATLGLNVC